MFLNYILERARANPKRIVYAEAGADDRILRAAMEVKNTGIAVPVFVGKASEIKQRAENLKLSIEGVEIIEPELSPRFEDFAATYYEMRKDKGVDPALAKETMKFTNYFAAMMVNKNLADGYVGGVNSITKPLKPALQIIGTKEKNNRVSGLFFMIFPDNRIFLFADCAMTIDPTSEQLAQFAIDSAETAKIFGISPKVAMMSFSTKGSAVHPLVDKVRIATEIAKKKRSDLIIDGEMQVDCAIVPSISEKKAPGSPVAGDANVFIFPDLNSGNIAYKLVEWIGNAKAVGPILQGLKMPVNDLSRGCTIEEIVYVTAITVLQAQGLGNLR